MDEKKKRMLSLANNINDLCAGHRVEETVRALCVILAGLSVDADNQCSLKEVEFNRMIFDLIKSYRTDLIKHGNKNAQ